MGTGMGTRLYPLPVGMRMRQKLNIHWVRVWGSGWIFSTEMRMR